MTALQAYYSAIAAGHLPATVPIRVNGERGLATQVHRIDDPSKAALARSEDPYHRILAAIYVLHNCHRRIAMDDEMEFIGESAQSSQ
jgi:hypothetical protein